MKSNTPVFLIFLLCILTSALFIRCKDHIVTPSPPVKSISIRSKRVNCTDFLNRYQNYDYFFFTFPGTAPNLQLKCTLINASDITTFTLNNLGSTHTVSAGDTAFNIAASRLTKEDIDDFIARLKLPPDNFDIVKDSKKYFINFKVNEIVPASDSMKYVVVTVTATRVGGAESKTTLKTNPCPPCSK